MIVEACTLAWCLTVTYSVPIGIAIPTPEKLETRVLRHEFAGERECRTAEKIAVRNIGRMMPDADIGLVARIESAKCGPK